MHGIERASAMLVQHAVPILPKYHIVALTGSDVVLVMDSGKSH